MSTQTKEVKKAWETPVITVLTRNTPGDAVFAMNVKDCDTTGKIHSCDPGDPFPDPTPSPTPTPKSDEY